MQNKTKNIVIIILSLLLAISVIMLILLIVKRNDTLKEITGTIIIADKGYVIIETEDEDYLINDIKEEYEVGDKVTFSYKEKNLNTKVSPYTINIEDEKLISRAPESDEPYDDDEPSRDDDSSITEPNVQTPSNVSPPTQTSEPTRNADTEVIEYIENLNAEFDDSSIKENIKSGFITVVDFIFYDGSIAGHTFEELSDSAKLKVLESALYFDEKIDTYFPGYKESVTSTTGKIYSKAKEEIVTTYLNVTTKICESNADLCNTAKETFEKIKTNVGLTWSLIKDIAGDGLANLKNWYEIWSGK